MVKFHNFRYVSNINCKFLLRDYIDIKQTTIQTYTNYSSNSHTTALRF